MHHVRHVSLPMEIGLVAVTATCALALAFGGKVERRAGVWIWAGWVLSLFVQRLAGRFDPALLFSVVDATMLGVLVALTWRSGRRWTVWAVTLQGVEVGVDLLRLLTPRLHAWTYLSALAVVSYLLLASLLAGVWSSWRRRRAGRT